MISSPSRLTSQYNKLVIDASVALNFLGTGRAADLLKLLNRTVLIDQVALSEIILDPLTAASGSAAMGPLIDAGLIHPTEMSITAYATFLDITGASPPDDLDDGEAATIAQAFDTDGVPVIDETKATRVVSGFRPNVMLLNTLDLFACADVVDSLTTNELSDILYGALRHSRMRVPLLFEAWVFHLIGYQRASKCPSLKRPALSRNQGLRK